VPAEVPAAPTGLPTLPGRRPEPRGEVRRAELLAALEQLLRERPLGALSIGEISRAAGLGRSAFYFYFPSKEAAVTELLRGIFEGMLDGARAWIDGRGEPRDSLRLALEGTATLWRAHRHLLLGMLDARGDATVQELWDSWIERFVEPLAGAVDAEREAGRAPAGTPSPVLIRLLLGMNERALEHNVRRDAGEDETRELVDALTSAWLAAIYGRPGSS
jgi:AcrR family transcriptional regulator